MSQEYHSNATTNVHIRTQICNSDLSNNILAQKYNISLKTVRKWKNRHEQTDKSSRPHNIEYAICEVLAAIIISLRSTTWLSKEEIFDIVSTDENKISLSSIYRLFVKHAINRIPKEKRAIAKKFKEYEPGFLHIDVTYLPSFNGQKRYLFVAIDRATRFLYYRIYDEKTAANAQDFLDRCIYEEFPFVIDYVLTDNGLEFTNRLIISKKGTACEKPSKFDVNCEKHGIEHRLTKPHTPQTNGMVERVNGTIKNATILRTKYKCLEEMSVDLNKHLIYYNLYRRHGSLKRELNVRTPFEALCKWYALKPELFYISPFDFIRKKGIFDDSRQMPKGTTL